jgi:predicted XRE-type DNA-binding protein
MMTANRFLLSLLSAGNKQHIERFNKRFRAENKHLIEKSLQTQVTNYVTRTQLSTHDIAEYLCVSPSIVRDAMQVKEKASSVKFLKETKRAKRVKK